ncbi:hypothetical protein OG21DRAFT_1067126 [Imleria badia]|nr:hypothetical protein OG21DRAFT_1067126 [Imleria badia]
MAGGTSVVRLRSPLRCADGSFINRRRSCVRRRTPFLPLVLHVSVRSSNLPVYLCVRVFARDAYFSFDIGRWVAGLPGSTCFITVVTHTIYAVPRRLDTLISTPVASLGPSHRLDVERMRVMRLSCSSSSGPSRVRFRPLIIRPCSQHSCAATYCRQMTARHLGAISASFLSLSFPCQTLRWPIPDFRTGLPKSE